MTTNECGRGRDIGLACTIMSMEGVQHGRICIIHMCRLDRIGSVCMSRVFLVWRRLYRFGVWIWIGVLVHGLASSSSRPPEG
jgi:hypothetical protein